MERAWKRVAGAGALLGLLTLWLFGEQWRPLRPSTWAMVREARLRKMGPLKLVHGYLYGRWTTEYIRVVLVRWIVPHLPGQSKAWLAERYHYKVLTPEQAEAIVTLDHALPLRDLEQVIPYATARGLVLDGPPDIAVIECGCRHARERHCEPTDVCMVVGQPFVDFVLEHKPGTSRRLSQAQALELLAAEHERGHVHTAWFKDALMDRFYAICNCCKCCCGGIEAMVRYGVPMATSSGYVAGTSEEDCTLCGVCEALCPFGAIAVEDGKLVTNWEKCLGCGVCVDKCAFGARWLQRDEAKGLPLDVRAMA